mmetsp:Transcript_16854/g.36600  ORF Transcript_16854/g.36600 Transcript_16854/m.36600 type:complete len:192 (-) Transcript_16854:739-1314(-)
MNRTDRARGGMPPAGFSEAAAAVVDDDNDESTGVSRELSLDFSAEFPLAARRKLTLLAGSEDDDDGGAPFADAPTQTLTPVPDGAAPIPLLCIPTAALAFDESLDGARRKLMLFGGSADVVGMDGSVNEGDDASGPCEATPTGRDCRERAAEASAAAKLLLLLSDALFTEPTLARRKLMEAFRDGRWLPPL